MFPSDVDHAAASAREGYVSGGQRVLDMTVPHVECGGLKVPGQVMNGVLHASGCWNGYMARRDGDRRAW